MALTKLEENLNIIENLADSPNLESDELKRKFDQGSIKIKEYINEVLTEEIDNLVTQINKDVSTKLLEDNKKKYYIGKLIFDTKNINPATYLGFGTWQLWGSGRVPVGVDSSDSNFNTVEKTGGSNTHNHNSGVTGSTTLTVEQIPAHNHSSNDNYYLRSAEGGMGPAGAVHTMIDYAKWSWYKTVQTQGGGKGHTHTIQSGSNIPKYITCYIWKRIS